jgi:hypothetical protein
LEFGRYAGPDPWPQVLYVRVINEVKRANAGKNTIVSLYPALHIGDGAEQQHCSDASYWAPSN